MIWPAPAPDAPHCTVRDATVVQVVGDAATKRATAGFVQLELLEGTAVRYVVLDVCSAERLAALVGVAAAQLVRAFARRAGWL